MSKFLLLAFRNVFRNRRRTVMTLVMVAGGVAGLLLAGGYFRSMTDGLRENTIRNGLGHIQIFNAEHFQRDEIRVLDTGIDDWRQASTRVSSIAHVRGVAPRIEFYGMVSNGQKSSVYMGSAVDPNAERSLGFTPNLIEGRDLDQSGEEVGALIGKGLARSMNAKVGDGLTLLAVTSDGALNGIDVQVAGIVQTGAAELDARYMRIPLVSAQRLLQSNRVTNLVVGLDSTSNTDRVYRELVPRLAGLPQRLELRKWIDLATYYKQVRNMFDGIFLFMGVIVFFMVLMSSVNTLLMSMFERTREIGSMLAMGTPHFWIVAMFMAEAGVLGLFGAVIGVLVGNLAGSLINWLDFRLPPPPGFTVGIPFHVVHVPAIMIGASLLVIVSLILASTLPALRASRLRITEALAHV